MKTITILRAANHAALALVMMIWGVSSAVADVYEYPAGVACPDFAVRQESSGSAVGFSGDGSRGHGLVFAGTGINWTFTNETTGTTWSPATSPAAAGAAQKVRPNADGSLTITITGNAGLIMFPTDFPAGPSTTWYTGKLVIEVDAAFNTIFKSSAGTKTDICAELSD
jgi:hypothetical protein